MTSKGLPPHDSPSTISEHLGCSLRSALHAWSKRVDAPFAIKREINGDCAERRPRD